MPLFDLPSYRELDKDGRELRERQAAFFQRLSMALFGGIALIGPMLVMVSQPVRLPKKQSPAVFANRSANQPYSRDSSPAVLLLSSSQFPRMVTDRFVLKDLTPLQDDLTRHRVRGNESLRARPGSFREKYSG